MAGIGFSTAEKIILSGSVSQANIFGSGKFVALNMNTGKINRMIGLSYTNPYFTVDGISQGFDVYHSQVNPQSLGYAYKKRSTGGGIRFGIPIGEKESINFGAGLDYTTVEIDNADPNTPIQYRNFADKFCSGANACSNSSVPLTAGWASDSKDSVILPTRGALQRATYTISPAGDIKFNRITYQHQLFFAVTRGTVLMLNGEVGYAKGIAGQELPYYQNFYAGGSGSVRGYDTASLGPYEISPVTGAPVRLGGVKRMIFNAEISMPAPGFGQDKSVRFGPFFDAGQVYGDKKSDQTGVIPEGPVRMSTGLAATWVSPFGPLKFSLAQPLNKQVNDKIQRFQFQMGQAF